MGRDVINGASLLSAVIVDSIDGSFDLAASFHHSEFLAIDVAGVDNFWLPNLLLSRKKKS